MQKRAKFNQKKAVYNGITFDSTAEMEYFKVLEYKKGLGKIKSFSRQPEFEVLPGFTDNEGKSHLPIKYKADFLVYHNSGKQTVVEVKGFATTDAMLKRKLFLYAHQDKNLLRVVKYQNRFVDYFENKKRQQANKREKKKAMKVQSKP